MELSRLLAEMGRDGPDDLAGSGGRPNLVAARRVDSTNRLARRIAAEYLGDEEAVPDLLLIALEQTAGRGRQGRSWESPAGGIYVTRMLSVAHSGELASLPLAAAIGLAEALSTVLPPDRPCRLKWPNDLLVGERKIGGVLIEALPAADGGAVALVGFGVNYRVPAGDVGATRGTRAVRGSRASRASRVTAIERECPEPPPLGACVRALAEGLEAALGRRGDADWAARRYRALTIHHPGDRLACRVGEVEVEGEFLGFTDEGHLRLATAQGERRMAAGELVEEAI